MFSDTFIENNKYKLEQLIKLGVLNYNGDNICRTYHIGKSDYSDKLIQPWAIWMDYQLDPWDADIVKRVLRTKDEGGLSPTESRILDYKKIIHDCEEKIRQLELSSLNINEDNLFK